MPSLSFSNWKGKLISDDYKNKKYVFKIQVNNFEFIETKAEHEKHKNKVDGGIKKWQKK